MPAGVPLLASSDPPPGDPSLPEPGHVLSGGKRLGQVDVPEAALSPNRQLALLAAMGQLVAKRSQFIIATHSPILMAYPGATIYFFGEEAPRQIEFVDTEHYQVTREFLANPERMLRELLDGARE